METDNKFDDLVFENRHKEYGAYAIRKSYNDSITLALFLTSVFFGGIALMAALFNGSGKIPDTSGNIPPIDSVLVYTFDLPHPDKHVIEEKKVQEKVIPRSDNPNYEVVDKKVETTAKVNDEGLVIKKDGSEKGVDSIPPTTDVPFVLATEGSVDPTEIIPVPDRMPELPNMDKFILDNLKYPRIAVDNWKEGTVYVSFIVEIDGSVTNIKLAKGIGDGCEEEAIRVVKIFPKWKPAIFNGRPVRSLCNLPLKFRLK